MLFKNSCAIKRFFSSVTEMGSRIAIQNGLIPLKNKKNQVIQQKPQLLPRLESDLEMLQMLGDGLKKSAT